jgi:septal ring factor EnvC (AmiA/AmiB activator)
MTTTSDLPDRVEALADQVRTVFDREISSGRKTVDDLNAQKATIQAEVSALQAQHKSARDQLSSVQVYLGRGSTLAGLDQKIAEKQKTLERLKADEAALKAAIAGATTARATAEKEQAKAEAQLTALRTEADDWRAERADAYTDIEKARALANSWRTTQ